MEKIYAQHWVDLPRQVRTKLIEIFGIVRTGISEVKDQTVVSDGTTNEDLKAITSEKMAAYVGSTDTFARLWELTLAKVKYELNPPTVEIGVGPIEELPEIKQETQDEDSNKEGIKSTTKKSK